MSEESRLSNGRGVILYFRGVCGPFPDGSQAFEWLNQGAGGSPTGEIGDFFKVSECNVQAAYREPGEDGAVTCQFLGGSEPLQPEAEEAFRKWFEEQGWTVRFTDPFGG
jgi:hypothetical protein